MGITLHYCIGRTLSFTFSLKTNVNTNWQVHSHHIDKAFNTRVCKSSIHNCPPKHLAFQCRKVVVREGSGLSEVQDIDVYVLNFSGNPEIRVLGWAFLLEKKHLCFYVSTSRRYTCLSSYYLMAALHRSCLTSVGYSTRGSLRGGKWTWSHLPLYKGTGLCALTPPAILYTWETCNT